MASTSIPSNAPRNGNFLAPLQEVEAGRRPQRTTEAAHLTQLRQSTGVAVRHLSMHLGEETRDRYTPLSSDPKRPGYLADSHQPIRSRGADPQLLGSPREVLYVVGE